LLLFVGLVSFIAFGMVLFLLMEINKDASSPVLSRQVPTDSRSHKRNELSVIASYRPHIESEAELPERQTHIQSRDKRQIEKKANKTQIAKPKRHLGARRGKQPKVEVGSLELRH
jgi:hypothetical protein